MRRPSQGPIVIGPKVHAGMQRGVNKIVGAIAPTLGPTPRMVAVDRILDQRIPEFLDDGAIIAQRILDLGNPDENAGAMLIRSVVESVGLKAGDGTATAAVVFRHIFNAGIRHLAAGGEVNVFRSHLERGARHLQDQMMARAEAIAGEANFSRLAGSLCHNPELAARIGDIFNTVGEYGRIEVRAGRDTAMRHEYVEGMYWNRGAVSRSMLTDLTRLRTEFVNGSILLSDVNVKDPRQLLPVVTSALENRTASLLIIVGEISDGALAFLTANNQPDRFMSAVVKVPGLGEYEKAAALQDLALLTGGRPIIEAAGETFDSLAAEDLGRARRVWIGERTFGLIGGRGASTAVLSHIDELKYLAQTCDDQIRRDQLMSRVGTLLGGSATLWLGGLTEMQIEERVTLAKRTVKCMRGAALHGVVPGGGAALLDCRSSLNSMMERSPHPDAKAAYRILGQAVAQPFRTIVHNAGFDPAEMLARVDQARVDQGSDGLGLDVRTGDVTDMASAGIVDSASTQEAAVYCAVTSAALALSVEALVHFPGNRPLGRLRDT